MSTTKTDAAVCAFATLRFAGDGLNPDDISRILGKPATRAYRKGESYRSGAHGPEIVGKTGVWYLSTRRQVAGDALDDHLGALLELLFPTEEAMRG